MRKFIYFVLIFIFVFKASIVSAQSPLDIDKWIPGIACGVAGETGGQDKCCKTDTFKNPLPKIPGFVEIAIKVIPIAHQLLDGYNGKRQQFDELIDFQKSYPGTVCIYGTPNTTNFLDKNCKCIATEAGSIVRPLSEMCYKYLAKTKELKSCVACAATNGMWTGLGCVPLSLKTFITNYLFSFGVSVAGLIALFCIIYSAFQLQTSQANPEKIKKAQENLTSCIVGLLLIIFSVFILRLIGVDILKIHGFGG